MKTTDVLIVAAAALAVAYLMRPGTVSSKTVQDGLNLLGVSVRTTPATSAYGPPADAYGPWLSTPGAVLPDLADYLAN